MSGSSRSHDSGRASIPPIEIGSFSAPRPDKSDFIGSASGVFFVNTVFRAFAAAAIPADGDHTEHAADAAGVSTAPDPGSAHSYLAADESTQAQTGRDEALIQAEPVSNETETSELRSYGVTAPAIGRPPPPAVAKKLIMLYFQNWHPFFPFLHGPTFVDAVDGFYQKGKGVDGGTDPPLNLRSKLCRAVTFQCIFSIAASGRDSVLLEAGSRIQSASALTSLLGAISGTHDISALQALLAAELYLTSTMSLRAASTVHGALTRILYHSGFHRCPFRFVQLPSAMYDIRKRIFWCAYVLDRHLSQALGYPVAIRDDEVDVCIPGMIELHRPVKPRESTSTCYPASGDDIREHLPRNPSGRDQAGHETELELNGCGTAETGDNDTQSPSHHHIGSPEAAGEYVLGYLVTYSRLVGASLDLFHKSIHKRVITRDKVLEMTYKTHAWWNSLPFALQDDLESTPTSSNSRFGAFFTMLYHHLVLLNNRPFLSLPTHTVDFRSCLQSALGASRTILMLRVRRLDASLLLVWPGTLSATWMAGLVIAYAGLLNLYPQEKAIADLHRCLVLLDEMGNNWASAGHCHAALKGLLDRLSCRPTRVQPRLSLDPSPKGPESTFQRDPVPSGPSVSSQQSGGKDWSSSNKRRRYNNGIGISVPTQSYGQVDISSFAVGPGPSVLQDWQPVLHYTGPDFGFDADQFTNHGEWQDALAPNLDPTSGLLFNNAGFEAYIQHFGDRLNV